MTKEDKIILKLVELTQDKKIKWDKKYIGKETKFFTTKINSATFDLLHYGSSITLLVNGKSTIYSNSTNRDLLTDLIRAITYDERLSIEEKQKIAIDKAYEIVMNFNS